MSEGSAAKFGSDLISALEQAWHTIQANHPELPDVVFITGRGREKSGVTWGHFGANRWVAGEPGHASESGDGGSSLFQPGRRPEVFVSGERLACGGRLTLQTMLHEGAHALAAVRDIRDTARQGRCHNRRFLKLAEEMGLAFQGDKADGTHGFSQVDLTDETSQHYAETIEHLHASINIHLDSVPAEPEEEGKKAGTAGKRAKAICRCLNPRSIRVAQSVLDEAPIICGSCKYPFEVEK